MYTIKIRQRRYFILYQILGQNLESRPMAREARDAREGIKIFERICKNTDTTTNGKRGKVRES